MLLPTHSWKTVSTSLCKNVQFRHSMTPMSRILSLPGTTRIRPPSIGIDLNILRTVREFSRKASKMGKHLETLNEMAHRVESEKAKERRDHKKLSRNHQEQPQDDETQKKEKMERDENSSNDTEEDHTYTSTLPSKDEVKSRMMKVLQQMETMLRSVRGAEPSAELFDAVPVKVYGTSMPLSSLAQVVITSPTLATITCFDPATTTAVRDAVRDMEGMNFNPRVEDNGTLLVPIPKMNIETRKLIVKQLNKIAEDYRQRIRRIRRSAQDIIKQGKDGKLEGISKDDAFRVGNQIDDVTEECIKHVNVLLERKSASIMSV